LLAAPLIDAAARPRYPAPSGRITSSAALFVSRVAEGGPMASNVGKLPENTSLIIPRLVCRDPAAEIDFCVRTFEAAVLNRRPGPDGSVAHALLTIGPEMIMIECEWPTLPSRAPAADGTSPVVIFVYVPDVDRTVERALACGGKVLVP